MALVCWLKGEKEREREREKERKKERERKKWICNFANGNVKEGSNKK